MKLVDLKVSEFIEQVDSSSPAPGGGSVAALASGLGVGLSRMVAHLTIGRKKYNELDESTQKEYELNFKRLETLKEKLLIFIDKDTEAFNKIMAAFKLPKDTDEDKAKRKEAIQVATLVAIEVPYEVAVNTFKALETIEQMLPYGNKNATSDIGVGALLLYTGLEGAILNVKINLSGLSDEETVNKYANESIELLEKGTKIKDYILKSVHEQIS